MKGKNTVRTLALAAVAALLLISPLQAATGCQKQAGPEKKMMGRGCGTGAGCMMLKKLTNLSEEQKAKLEKLHAEQQKAMGEARVAMEKLAGDMQALLKEPVDIKKAEAKIDELAKFRAAMQKKHLAHFLAVRALLTDEQKAKIGTMGCQLGMAGGMGMGRKHGAGCCQSEAKGRQKAHPQAGKGCGHMHGQDKPECQKEAEKKTP